MANINLLPWREEAREKRKRDYTGVLALVFIVSCIVVYAALGFIDMLKNEQRQRNAYLTSEISLLESQIKEIRSITERKKDIERRTDIILDLQQSRNLPTHILDELVRVVPAGIYFSNIEKEDDMLFVEGLSESNNHVTNMMRRIESSEWLGDSTPQQVKLGENNARLLQKFTMQISIMSAANDRNKKNKEVKK
ncbi:PilN domain-containing protein [Shewanella sp. 202IG2-18]|uniref:PilN domain-containing protein n=1 Tax=Parashewanella hymeniacidonis TaxID=2807618 RepID=UPI00196072A6|nr:PilN domain-containing protein [Parashewanella hymeniacidonis]MBM7072295.1 PilN domain-containing protein [Parashewanella hymeniacidonis]